MKLRLDRAIVNECDQAARRIVQDVMDEISGKTTLSVERATARAHHDRLALSRMINGWAGIVINTGEDNYPRTANHRVC
jgi:D-Lysine 5,6-aminomutase TIM-barrel domain of alpha subunit